MNPEKLWETVVKHARLRVADQTFFRFSAYPSEARDKGLVTVYDQRRDAVIGPAAVDALEAVCEELYQLRPEAVTPSDLTVHVMRYAVEAATGDDGWQALVREFERWTSVSIVTVPLGGIFSSHNEPIRLGKSALVGHLSRETEQKIGIMAVEHGLHGFRFTEAWWTEMFLAAEADGGIALELSEHEYQAGTWQPLVLAIALPAVGCVASYRALCAAEGLLGVLILMHEPEHSWHQPSPWILGDTTFAENPRSPTLDYDGTLPKSPIQVDSLPDHGVHGYAPMEHNRPAPDLDFAVELENAATAAIVDRLMEIAAESDYSPLLEASRLVFGAARHSDDIAAPLLSAAIRAIADSSLDEPAVPRVQPADVRAHADALRERMRGELGRASAKS